MRFSTTDRRWQRELTRPMTPEELAFIETIAPTCAIHDHHMRAVLMMRSANRRVWWYQPSITPERVAFLALWASRIYYGVRPSFTGEQKRLFGVNVVIENRQDAAVHLPNGRLVFAPPYKRTVIVAPDTQCESLVELAKSFPHLRLDDDFYVVAKSDFKSWAMSITDPERIQRMFCLCPMNDLMMMYATMIPDAYQLCDRPKDETNLDMMWSCMGIIYKGKSLAHMRINHGMLKRNVFRLTEDGAYHMEKHIKRNVVWLPDNFLAEREPVIHRHADGSAGVAQVVCDFAQRHPYVVTISNDKAQKVAFHLKSKVKCVIRPIQRIEANDMPDGAYVIFGGEQAYRMFVERHGLRGGQTAVIVFDSKLRVPVLLPAGSPVLS